MSFLCPDFFRPFLLKSFYGENRRIKNVVLSRNNFYRRPGGGTEIFMIPDFTIFGKTFSAYMITALIGIFAAGLYALYEAKKKKLDEIDFLVTLLWGCAGVFFGGHILYAITNYRLLNEFIVSFGEIWIRGDFFNYVMLIFGGSVFYGGLIGGLCTGRYYSDKKGLPTEQYSDIAASAVPLFHMFGRIGCFLSGCCYGVPSVFGITYTHSAIEAANNVCRFPVQLLEAAGNLILFLVFRNLLRKGWGKGKLIYFYLISYGAIRFADEFLRGDEYRGVFSGISTSQIIAIITILYATAYLIKNKRKNKKTQG